jgi:hypothetical protein
MPDQRFPTMEEFWRRLASRDVEFDLRQALALRAQQEDAAVTRLGKAGTVVAVIDRMLPESAVPAAVIAGFVDSAYDRPLGRGDERDGVMPREQLIPVGFAQLDEAAGGDFGALAAVEQDALLARAERGELDGPAGFDAKSWFERLRDLVLLGFGSDPRGMVQMGYPGPSYKPGHVWLEQDEIQARAARKPGYLTF